MKPNVKAANRKYIVYELQLEPVYHAQHLQKHLSFHLFPSSCRIYSPELPKSQHQLFITLMVSLSVIRVRNQRFLIFSAEELDRDVLGLDLVAELEMR